MYMYIYYMYVYLCICVLICIRIMYIDYFRQRSRDMEYMQHVPKNQNPIETMFTLYRSQCPLPTALRTMTKMRWLLIRLWIHLIHLCPSLAMQGQLKPRTFCFLFCILNLKQHWFLLRLHWPPGYTAELLPLSLRNRYIPLKLKVCEGRFHRTSPSLWSTWKEGCCILWVARQPAGWWYVEPSIRSGILDKNPGDDRTNTNSKNLGNPFIQFIVTIDSVCGPPRMLAWKHQGILRHAMVRFLGWAEWCCNTSKNHLNGQCIQFFPSPTISTIRHLSLHTVIPLRRFLVRL